MSDLDTLREPQRHQPYAEVPAPVPRPWPTRPVPLRATVAGAGRLMDLDEFLAVTVSTALVVVVDGVLVHERYFRGTRRRGPAAGLLRHQVRAGPGGRAGGGRRSAPRARYSRDRPGSGAGLQRVRGGE